MAVNRKSGGANVALALANIKRRSGAGWVTATIAKKRSGGVWVDLFAAGGLTATVQTATYSASAFSPNDATITVIFNSNGLTQISQNNGGSINQYTWQGNGTASQYDIRATVTSGTVSGSATATWLNLASSVQWSCIRTENLTGTTTAVLTVEIRDASTLALVASGTVTLQAVVEI
jgi:hypothetical protein